MGALFDLLNRLVEALESIANALSAFHQGSGHGHCACCCGSGNDGGGNDNPNDDPIDDDPNKTLYVRVVDDRARLHYPLPNNPTDPHRFVYYGETYPVGPDNNDVSYPDWVQIGLQSPETSEIVLYWVQREKVDFID